MPARHEGHPADAGDGASVDSAARPPPGGGDAPRPVAGPARAVLLRTTRATSSTTREIRQLWPPLLADCRPPRSRTRSRGGRSRRCRSLSSTPRPRERSRAACRQPAAARDGSTRAVRPGAAHAAAARGWVPFPPEIAAALAAVSALLWAVHPLNMEPVAYAVQRTEAALGAVLPPHAVRRAARDWRWGARLWTAIAVGGVCRRHRGCKETMASAAARGRRVRLGSSVRRSRSASAGRCMPGSPPAGRCWGAAAVGHAGCGGAARGRPADAGPVPVHAGPRDRALSSACVLWPRPLAIVLRLASGWTPLAGRAAAVPADRRARRRDRLGPLAAPSPGFVGACVFMALAPSIQRNPACRARSPPSGACTCRPRRS
jgi:hypothetical protein